MRYKVKILVEKYAAVISRWEGVEAVTLNEAALTDTLDSYFALILDVFCAGDLPFPDERQAAYGDDAAAFETTGAKDRFLVGNIPLRFEFKRTARIHQAIMCARDGVLPPKEKGTYTFYRVAEGEILYSRSGWIETARAQLANLSADFWEKARAAGQAKMEHSLSDMGAALIQDDHFAWLISSAAFIHAACQTLFCVNRRFEPSHRQYYSQVTALATLPAAFRAQFDTFLRIDTESTMERRYETAQLLARGIIAL